MKTRELLIVTGILVSALFGASALATETEHIGIDILPAPGKVSIDGKIDDWDLSGGIFVLSDVESLRDDYGVWFHLMYDNDNLYVLARWNDPTPLNNPGSSKGDMGFMGDCLQVRFITHYKEKGKERTTHWTCWRDRDGIDVMDMQEGRDFNGQHLRDAQEKGARQEFSVYENGKGYIQEISIPWSLLTADGKPLQPGDELRTTVEVNYTAGAGGRVTMKDIFMPNMPLDRVFTFRAYEQWGIGRLRKEGNLDPRPVRLSDNREFKVTMKDGLPTIDWTGLEQKKALPGFIPITFTMPDDGYVSLNIYDKDGTVVRQLLNCEPMAKGMHTVMWDGLTTPYWRTPGEPVKPGVYRWKALYHPGIGLRLRGWACNGGSAPWDNGPGTNWGGDHGVPSDCTTDGERVYLGWTGAEAGRALVACDLQGNVLWRHTHGGMGGAELLAVDNGVVYVLSHGSTLYRLRAEDGSYSNWEGSPNAAVHIGNMWKRQENMPTRIEGLDAKNGKLFVTCSSVSFRRSDVKSWEALLKLIYKQQGLAKKVYSSLTDWSRNRLKWWIEHHPEASVEEVCRKPNYYTPDLRDDVIGVFNKMLSDDRLTPESAGLPPDRLAHINRAFIEKTFAGHFVPLRTDFLAIFDGATGELKRLIALDMPRRIHAVSDTLVYVVIADGSKVVAVNPQDGSVKTVLNDLKNACDVTTDSEGRLYVSVHDPDQQVKVFTPDGKLVGTIGKKGGRPATGPWVAHAVMNPAGIVVDAEGKLWVAEATYFPKRFSVWDTKTGAFVKEFFGSTHYGASGGAINPDDPNLMVGESCEWRLDPDTGRAQCVGVIDDGDDREWNSLFPNFARFCRGNNGRTYLAITFGTKTHIYERLGEGRYALRATFGPNYKDRTTEFWSDENGDQQEQDAEKTVVQTLMSFNGYLNWSLGLNTDLTLFAGILDPKTGRCVGGARIDLAGFTACGAPKWDTKNLHILPPLEGPMPSPDNKLVLSCDVEKQVFSCYEVSTGKLLWTYPNTFHGVHGSHMAPGPQTGLIRGAFGIVGSATLPEPIGYVWVINTNVGEWHMLTRDGFYLTRLFQGDYSKVQWPEKAVPGAVLDNVPCGEGGEDFGGSIAQGKDGTIYVTAGKTANWNVKVVGLDTVRKLGFGKIRIEQKDLALAEAIRSEMLQRKAGIRRYEVRKMTPEFTGDLEKDFNGNVIVFKKQDDAEVRAAMAWDDEFLYLGWRVKDTTPWVNGADAPEYMYARGDTVDFQLGTDPNADELRTEAVKGDLRLSIGNFKGTPTAVLYRKVSDQKNPKTFSSGLVKNYVMDSVTVLKEARIEVKKGDRWYVVEAAIPLASLGLQPFPGLKLIGDFGATHGTQAGDDTALRTYWSNQCTGLVNDEVFELKMEPRNWGQLQFR